MSIPLKLLQALLLTACALCTHAGVAAEAVGKATFVNGEVQARSTSGASRPLARGGEIYAGDTVITGANGSVQLLFADQSRMAVRPSTEVAVDQFKLSANGAGNDDSIVMRLTRGALRSITGLIGKRNKQNVSLRTPVATIGIRGTDFEAVHVPSGGAGPYGAGDVAPGTYNKVYAGGTQMTSKAGVIDLNINETGFIGLGTGAGKGPVKIDQLPPGILKVINSAPALGNATKPGESSPAPGEGPAAEPGAPPPPGDGAAPTTLRTTIQDKASVLAPVEGSTITKLPTTNTTINSGATLKTLDPAKLQTIDSSVLKNTTLQNTTTTDTAPVTSTITKLPTTSTTLQTAPVLTSPTTTINNVITNTTLQTAPVTTQSPTTTTTLQKLPTTTTTTTTLPKLQDSTILVKP